MYYNKFDKFLIKMSNDLPKRRIPFPESIIHIYHDDYLYTNIKNLITFDKPVCLNKWSYSHEFIVSGINMRLKHSFDLLYPGSLRFDDDDYNEDYPYLGKERRLIKDIIDEDDGRCNAIEIVRKIALATHILVMPYFVHTTRFRYMRYVQNLYKGM
jgi:hypothetical protein